MKLDWKLIYTLGTFFIIATSGLYLFGYWGVFDIDILPYMNVSEVIRFSLYNIFIMVLLFTPIVILGDISRSISQTYRSVFADKPNRKKNRKKYIFIMIRLLLLRVEKSLFSRNRKFLKYYLYFYIATLAIIYIPLSYYFGVINASQIRDNISYNYLEKDNLFLPSEKIKMLGRTDGYLFFSTLDNTKTIVVNNSEAKILILKSFNNK